MKIRRYLLTIYDCDVHEDKEGDWVKYEEVEPLLERIKELEQQLEFERCVTYYSLGVRNETSV